MKLPIFLSATLCALSLSVQAMEPIHEPQSSQFRNYVNVKSFCMDLCSLLTEDTIDLQKFHRLLQHIKIENIPQLFSLDPETASRYLSFENLKLYILLISESSFRSRPQRRAALLKQCYKADALQELLGCTDLDTVLSTIIDIYFSYLEGDVALKKQKLAALKEPLKRCAQQQGDKKNYISFAFDIPEILAIIDDLIQDIPVSDERIIKCILCDTSLKVSGLNKHVEEYTLVNNMLKLIVAALKAGKAPSFRTLLGCVKWETLLEKLPVLFGYTAQDLEYIFKKAELTALITDLRNGKCTTGNDIIDTLNPELFDYIVSLGPIKSMIFLTLIKEFIDFDALADFLNALSQGTPDDSFKRVIKTDNIEKHMEIDVPGALDTDIPEPIQTSLLMTVKERFDVFTDTRKRYSIPMLLYPVPFLLISKALSARTRGATWAYACGSAASVVMLGTFGWIIYGRPVSVESHMANAVISSIACNAMRAISFFTEPLKTDDIIKHAQRGYEGHDALPEFCAFVKRLGSQELAYLSNPYKVCNLLEDPFDFIDRNERFIDECARNKEHGTEMLKNLSELLCKTLPPQNLKMGMTFKLFFQSLTGNDLNALSNRALMGIALYRPAILARQMRFIASIKDRTLSDGRRSIDVLETLVESTRNSDDIVRS